MSELGATFAGIVTDGSLLVAIAVAALVGLISFASPCCLPLIPGYVSYIAGLAGSQATAEEELYWHNYYETGSFEVKVWIVDVDDVRTEATCTVNWSN